MKSTVLSLLLCALLLPLGARAQGALGIYGITAGASISNQAYALIQPFAAAGNQANIGIQPGVADPRATAVEPEALSGVQAFPNPVSAVLQVSIENPMWSQASFQLQDLNGRLVYLAPAVLGDNRFDLQMLPSGTYAMRLVSAQGKVSQAMLIRKP